MRRDRSLKLKLLSVIILMNLLITSLPGMTCNAIEKEDEFVDKIHIDVAENKDRGMTLCAMGERDLYLHPLDVKDYEDMPRGWKIRTSTWEGTDSYVNLRFNPVYNKSTGLPIVDTEPESTAKEYRFNPFGIKKVRYAMNWFINREKIKEEIYGGYAERRFTCVSPSYPSYETHFAPIVDDHNITEDGDEQKALRMIDESMNDVKTRLEEHPDFGSIKEENGDWKYKGPDEKNYSTITIEGWPRTEDEREQIADYFSNKIEKAGFNVDLHKEEHKKATEVVFYSDVREQQWHFYTGAWLQTDPGKYGMLNWAAHYYSVQYLMDWEGYGEEAYPGWKLERAWYYINESLKDHAEKIDNKTISMKKGLWRRGEKLVKLGIEDSVVLPLISEKMNYMYNRFSVTNAAPDPTLGYDPISIPRTIKTGNGTLDIVQYDSAGGLYHGGWNRIAGNIGHKAERLQKILTDKSVIQHPFTKENIPARAEFDVELGYRYIDGVLQKNITVPSDAKKYDPVKNEWHPVDSDNKASVKATFSWTGFGEHKKGKWHDGHNITERDILAWYAFSAELVGDEEKDDDGDRREDDWAEKNEQWFRDLVGIEWGEPDGTFTVYSNYTFPVEKKVAEYLSITPYKPWQLMEGAEQCVIGSGLADTSESYSWGRGVDNTVNFLSSKQSDDFAGTIKNMKDADYIPPYLRADNNCPLPIDSSEMADEIESIIDFEEEYDHLYDSQGPFLLTDYDPEKSTMDMERFAYEGGKLDGRVNINKEEVSGEKVVQVSIPIENRGNEPVDWKITIDGEVVKEGTLRAFEKGHIDIKHSFDKGDDHTIRLKDGSNKNVVDAERLSLEEERWNEYLVPSVLLSITAIIVSGLFYTKRRIDWK